MSVENVERGKRYKVTIEGVVTYTNSSGYFELLVGGTEGNLIPNLVLDTCVSVEAVKPPLPDTIGAVVLVGSTAYMRRDRDDNSGPGGFTEVWSPAEGKWLATCALAGMDWTLLHDTGMTG